MPRLANGISTLAIVLSVPAFGQPAPGPLSTNDPAKVLIGRLDLEKYKATIKGLTQFGDRLQGTERNRRAVDWIEASSRVMDAPMLNALHTFPARHRSLCNRALGRHQAR